jgi:hypothetical protein
MEPEAARMTQTVGEDSPRPPTEARPAPSPAAAATGLTLPADEQHAPRPLTARAKRQAWLEPRARSWLLAAVALGLLAAYMLISEYINYHQDAWLFDKGLRVEAKLVRVETAVAEGQKYSNEPARDVHLEYQAGGKAQVFKGYLTSFDGGILEVGKKIPIRVDPTDPERFTARQRPVALLPHLVAGLTLLPLVAVAAGIAALRRRKLLRLWETGELLPAVVIRTSGVAVAPSVRAVECTGTDSDDTAIRRAFLPTGRGVTVPAHGDLIWLIVASDRKGPTIAADWFSSRSV